MLFLLLKLLNLLDRFFFCGALSSTHLILAESDEALLVSVLSLDGALELRNEFLDRTFRITPDFLILAEARDLLVVVECLTTGLEEVLGHSNVGLLEKTVCLL